MTTVETSVFLILKVTVFCHSFLKNTRQQKETMEELICTRGGVEEF